MIKRRYRAEIMPKTGRYGLRSNFRSSSFITLILRLLCHTLLSTISEHSIYIIIDRVNQWVTCGPWMGFGLRKHNTRIDRCSLSRKKKIRELSSRVKREITWSRGIDHGLLKHSTSIHPIDHARSVFSAFLFHVDNALLYKSQYT